MVATPAIHVELSQGQQDVLTCVNHVTTKPRRIARSQHFLVFYLKSADAIFNDNTAVLLLTYVLHRHYFSIQELNQDLDI